MFALVSELVYAPGQWAASQAQRAELLALVAQQPGYRGVAQVDVGEGRYLTLFCWDSQAQREAAGPVVEAARARLLAPWLAAPFARVGLGAVVRNTLTAGTTLGYAVVGETHYVPALRAAGQAQDDEFWALRAAQPGCRGALEVDEGGGRYLTLLLWDSQAQWEAAHRLLSAAAARLLAPLRAGPTQPLGAGTVVYDALTASVASA